MMQQTVSLLSAGASLVGVLALILLAGKIARWRGLARRLGVSPSASRTRRLVLADSLPLEGGRRLHLVEYDGERLLLLTGGSQDALLAAGRLP
jgi:flagellar biogenesis protein FliO